MSSQPMNPKIEEAITILKGEAVDTDGEIRALQNLRAAKVQPSRPVTRRWAIAATAVAAVAVFAFYPRRNDGQAWAQAMKRSVTATKVHQWVEQDGKKIFENWLDGDKFAMTMMYGNRIDHLYRTDGKKLFYYYGGAHGWTGQPDGSGKFVYTETLPKTEFRPPVAAFIGMTPVQTDFPIKESIIMQFYRIKDGAKAKEPRREMLDGREVLTSTSNLPFGTLSASSIKIYVDPKVPEVVRVDETSQGKTTVWHFDYPESIDPHEFDTEAMPGVPRYDCDEDRQKLTAAMKKGFGSKSLKGVNVKLLAVVRDVRSNALTILWKGLTVASWKDDQRAEVAGNPTLQDVTPGELTTMRYSMDNGIRYILDRTYTGSAIVLKNPIGQTVDVRIPVLAEDKKHPMVDREKKFVGYLGKKIGTVEFKNVPVITVGSLHALRRWEGDPKS